MTDQITVPRATWDATVKALELAMDNLRPHGDNCFLHDEGEYNACFCGKDSLVDHLQSVVESAALTAANAVKEQPILSPDAARAMVAEMDMNDRVLAAIDAESQAQGESYSERWYGSGEDRGWWIVRGGLVKREHVAFLGEFVSPEEVSKVVAELNAAHPQATEPAGWERDPLDLGQYVNGANISANDKPVAVIEKLQAVINERTAHHGK